MAWNEGSWKVACDFGFGKLAPGRSRPSGFDGHSPRAPSQTNHAAVVWEVRPACPGAHQFATEFPPTAARPVVKRPRERTPSSAGNQFGWCKIPRCCRPFGPCCSTC